VADRAELIAPADRAPGSIAAWVSAEVG